jgi:hypothetical protein
MDRTVACPKCGITITADATLCVPCRLEAVERMLLLRQHLTLASPEDPPSLPYTYHKLGHIDR